MGIEHVCGGELGAAVIGEWIDKNAVGIIEKIGDALHQLPIPIPLPVLEGMPVPLLVP